MATAAELDAQWEAQFLVVKQKNDERIAALKTLANSPAYQNSTEAEKDALIKSGPAETARLAFNTENQKLTALQKELNAARAAEKEKAETEKNTPPPPANAAEPTKTSPSIADSDKLGDSKPVSKTISTPASAPTTNSGTTLAGKASTVEQKSNDAKVGLRDYNPLSKFSSYTYNISLYVLDPNAYNRYMDGDRTAIKDFKLLVKSGGANLTETNRATGFELDLYIDDLSIKSMITAKSAGSPTTSNKEYKFKIYEPYGLSFTHKLTNAVGESVTDITKIKGIFFLLIKFYGYDANGKIVYGSDIPGFSNNNADPQSIFERGFAIAFKSFTFKLENKLVVYDITAQDQVVNAALGTAKGTIAGNKEIAGTTVEEILLGNTSNKSVKGLIDILNKDEEAKLKAKNPTIEVKNQYSILIKSDEIKNSLMVPGDYVNKEKTPFVPVTSSDNVNERTAYNNKKGAIQKKIRPFPITSGMHILKAIDLVISQSTYVKDALNSFDKEQLAPISESRDDTNVPNPNPKNISWYNIVPFVKVLNTGSGPNGKDMKRQDFAYSITYIINKYEIPYIRSVYASKTLRYYGPHKRYNYWYTGQNSEIISYDVTFNHLYQNDIAKTSDARIDNTNSSGVTTTSKSGINADTSGTLPGSNDVTATIKSWLYSPGDVQKFKLKILGDPDYLIPTYSAADMAKLNAFYGPDFTIDPSQGQVFIEIDFQQVEDYDTQTGLLKPNHDIFFANYPDYIKAKGFIYMITEVTSTFSKGKFEQDIVGAVPEFADIGNAGNRKKDVNQSDAETARLARQGKANTKPTASTSTSTSTSTSKSSGQNADTLANTSRANTAKANAAKANAAKANANPKTKVADDDSNSADSLFNSGKRLRESTMGPLPNLVGTGVQVRSEWSRMEIDPNGREGRLKQVVSRLGTIPAPGKIWPAKPSFLEQSTPKGWLGGNN